MAETLDIVLFMFHRYPQVDSLLQSRILCNLYILTLRQGCSVLKFSLVSAFKIHVLQNSFYRGHYNTLFRAFSILLLALTWLSRSLAIGMGRHFGFVSLFLIFDFFYQFVLKAWHMTN